VLYLIGWNDFGSRSVIFGFGLSRYLGRTNPCSIIKRAVVGNIKNSGGVIVGKGNNNNFDNKTIR
jgi:hypothetical protein